MILGLRWIGSLFDWSRFVCTMIPLFSPLLRPRKHALHSGPVHQYFGVTYSNNRGLGRMITPCRPSKWFEVRDYNDKTAKMTPKAVIKTQNLTPKIPAVQHTQMETNFGSYIVKFPSNTISSWKKPSFRSRSCPLCLSIFAFVFAAVTNWQRRLQKAGWAKARGGGVMDKLPPPLPVIRL